MNIKLLPLFLLFIVCTVINAQVKKSLTNLEILQARGLDPRVSNIYPTTSPTIPLWLPVTHEVPASGAPRTYRLKTQLAVVAPNIRIHPNATTTQSEMSIKTHPLNPDIVLAGSNAIHTTISVGSQGWYYSTNGGTTWSGRDTLPTHTNFSTRLGDPGVEIDLDNRLFFSSLNLGSTNDVFVSRSTNNGANWSQTIVSYSSGVDKDHFCADVNIRSPYEGNLYSAFTDFNPIPSPIVFSRSMDHGQSFTLPVSISGSIGSYFAQGVNIAVGPNGEVYAVWSGYDNFPTTTTKVGFNFSTNGGVTWATAKSIDTIYEIRGYLTKGRDSIRVASFPSMALDRSTGPRHGWIYVVYPEKNTTTPDIKLIRSTDGGASWSVPKKVNQDNSGKDQWSPWVTVDPATGGLYVVYYDSRNFPANDSAQIYVSSSLDGGNTFEDVLVSDAPFLPAPIPGLADRYMGDYIGVAAVNGVVWPCWNDNRTGIHQAYTARMVFIDVNSSATISVSPDTLNFGTAFVGYADTMTLKIRNLGYPNTLFVSDIHADTSLFSPLTTSMTVPAGNSRNLSVVFTPVTTGIDSGVLLITSNDTSHPILLVPMRGNVVYPPVIGVSPDSLSFTVNEADSANAIISLHNGGLGVLNYNINVESGVLNQYTIPLHMVDSSGFSAPIIRFGIHPNATYGIDYALGEGEAFPGFPLSQQFIDIPGRTPAMGSGIKLDLRPYIAPAQVDTYRVRFWDFEGFPVTFSWPDTLSSFLAKCQMTNYGDGSTFNADMITSSSITITDSRTSDLLIITIGRNNWPTAMPSSGTISPGGDQLVALKVKTDQLEGGTFHAVVKISSNDPVKPEVNFPVRLRVIGKPKIVLPKDTLNFGEVFINYPDTLLFAISNNGTDTLHVTGMTSNNPKFVVLDPTVFDVPKNTSHDVRMRFLPTAAGGESGTLSIMSNDTSHPTVNLYLLGDGIYPPVIGVIPDSLAFALHENDSANAIIYITNHGLSGLQWEATVSGSKVGFAASHTLPARAISLSAEDVEAGGAGTKIQKGKTRETEEFKQLTSVTANLADLSGKRIGIITQSNDYTVISSDLRLRGASVYDVWFPSASGDLDNIDVLAIDDAIGIAADYEITFLRSWVQGGKAIIVQGDNAGSMSNINKLLSGTGITEASLGTYYDAVFMNILPHLTTASVDSINAFSYGAYSIVTLPAKTIVYDDVGQPNIVISTLGSGRVFVSGNEVMADYNLTVGDTRLFSNQVFDWLSGSRDFLSINPSLGSVVAGDSQSVQVKVRADRLGGGTFRADLAISSNDPANPKLRVPVSLEVFEYPDISITEDTLDFGDVVMSVMDSAMLRISNIGSGELHVANIISSNVCFTVETTLPFDVDGHSFKDIYIRVQPNAVGLATGLLTIYSNDPRDSITIVHLAANGILSLTIRIAPETLMTNINYGDSTTLSLMIFNDGLGPLKFTVDDYTPEGEVAGGSSTQILGHYIMRGNIYRVYSSSILEQFSTYVDVPSPTTLQFAVYEATTKDGNYHRLKSTIIPVSTPRRKFYSSGTLKIPLSQGRYYFLGTATFGNATFFSKLQTLPANIPFGQAALSGLWSYDETHTEITPVVSTTTLWYQSVVISGTFIRSISPSSGTIESGDSRMLSINVKGELPIGILSGDVFVNSNDPATPRKHVPLSLTIPLLVDVSTGWNLISVPDVMSDNRKRVLFPTAISDAFCYAGMYITAEALKSGLGYWLKFSSNQTISIAEPGMAENSIDVNPRWNLIGVPYAVIRSNILSIPSNNIISHFIGYSNAHGYFATDSIMPGKGFWVKVRDAGQLILDASNLSMASPSAIQKQVELIPNETITSQTFNVITFTDGAGRIRTLYFSASPEVQNTEWLDLPPATPSGTFDVRFASQRLAEVRNSTTEYQEYPIILSDAKYPLSVRWTIHESQAGHSLSITYEDGRADHFFMNQSGSTILSKGTIQAMKLQMGSYSSAQIPKCYAMDQNYPNPFNPLTVIRYQLPISSHVTLKVYNILGEEVATLVDGVQDAGYKHAELDASRLASGVYVYKISARKTEGSQESTFTDVKKMLLIK